MPTSSGKTKAYFGTGAVAINSERLAIRAQTATQANTTASIVPASETHSRMNGIAEMNMTAIARPISSCS